jgi:hypothetical protein
VRRRRATTAAAAAARCCCRCVCSRLLLLLLPRCRAGAAAAGVLCRVRCWCRRPAPHRPGVVVVVVVVVVCGSERAAVCARAGVGRWSAADDRRALGATHASLATTAHMRFPLASSYQPRAGAQPLAHAVSVETWLFARGARRPPPPLAAHSTPLGVCTPGPFRRTPVAALALHTSRWRQQLAPPPCLAPLTRACVGGVVTRACVRCCRGVTKGCCDARLMLRSLWVMISVKTQLSVLHPNRIVLGVSNSVMLTSLAARVCSALPSTPERAGHC